MRIGELLIESAIVDTESLETALEYASSKSIPVGRALRALRYITEADLQRGLDAQHAIRQGLEGALAVAILRYAHQTNRSFVQSLRKLPATVGQAKVPQGLIDFLSAPTSLDNTMRTPKVRQLPSTDRPAEKFLMQGDQFFEANQLELAEAAYLRACQQLEDTEITPEKRAAVLTKLANLYLATDRFHEAAPLYQRVIDLQVQAFGRSSSESVRALEDLADLHLIAQENNKAQPCLLEALDIVEQLPPNLMIAGRLLKKFAQSAGAAEPNSRTRVGELAVDAKLLPAEKLQSPLAISQATGQPIGLVLRIESLLDDQQVESIIFAQLLIKQGTLPPPAAARAIKMAAAYNIPLRQLCEAGRWVAEAVSNDADYQKLVLEQERLVTNEGILGADHPEIAAIAMRVGDLHMARQDRLSAEMLYKRSLSILQKLPHTDQLQIARLCEKLSQALYQQNKYNDARDCLVQSFEQRKNAGEAETIDAAKILWLAAKIEIIQSNYFEALPFLRQARSIFDIVSPGNCPRQLLAELAKCAAATGMKIS